jgi:penicillin-binding protein 1A
VLQQVITSGTGTAAQLGRPAAGKTGTAQGWRNAWFCGYVPQLATAVWVGYPGGEQLAMVPPRTPVRVTGGSYPAHIWRGFMSAATEAMERRDFVAPVAPTTTTTLPPPTTAPPPPTTGAPIVVPSVIGAPVEQATATLQGLGFRVTTTQDRGNGGGPPGRVVGQSPEPGQSLGVGAVITLVVTPPPGTTTTTAAPVSSP